MKHRLLSILVLLLWMQEAQAQIPVEIFAGDKRASFDLMFFKFLQNKAGQNSKFLFFSRERAVVNYEQTAARNLPQFGFTEALSYNHAALKGFAPVLVGQVLSWGTFAKMGVQYSRVSKTLTLFGWSVVALGRQPDVDLFLLLRYTPRLGEKWQLFSQVELINTWPTNGTAPFNFAQRLRLGLKKSDWEFGLGGDFSSVGRKSYTTTPNTGLFFRHEF